MSFTPRPYQQEAIDKGIEYFQSVSTTNAIEILPTGSGKSVVIANISAGLDGELLVFQPSKEILEQNFAKYVSYGYRAAVWSASAGQKRIDKVTFATIGSVDKVKHLFRSVKYILIDECHLVNPKQGQYHDFIKYLNVKVLGLTATPYRLESGYGGAILNFLTRSTPCIFNEVIYHIQNSLLFEKGYLARLEYYSFNVVDRTQIEMNSAGNDFEKASLLAYYKRIDMPSKTAYYSNRLLQKRKNLLIFCSLISEAQRVVDMVPGAVVLTGKTEKILRERILRQFKAGEIKCVVNVGVLTTGFDYPELECVLLARSTMSLALYYQMVGRGMRIHSDKESCWIVDLGGNINFFGKIETMKIEETSKGLYYIQNNGKQLTNVTFKKK